MAGYLDWNRGCLEQLHPGNETIKPGGVVLHLWPRGAFFIGIVWSPASHKRETRTLENAAAEEACLVYSRLLLRLRYVFDGLEGE